MSTVITSEESEKSENLNQNGGNFVENLNNNLLGGQNAGKKYVEDEELDPELEKLLYDDDDKPKKKKTKKGWTALNGPLRGQTIYPSPITYYRYDPVLYTEYINYIPVFTEEGRPKRMVYDIYMYNTLK